ncbi:alpha/beta fold hydrolase [Kitasatospora aureofaciens]|uniref:alpha/beta fold hydrolase n=1 Tax=Kitasatospora aureofaciens TaxID=1894 RepID=UPI0037C761AE
MTPAGAAGTPAAPDGPQDTPHGSLHVIEGSGHMPHEEQPAAFNRLLRSGVREMAGAAA